MRVRFWPACICRQGCAPLRAPWRLVLRAQQQLGRPPPRQHRTQLPERASPRHYPCRPPWQPGRPVQISETCILELLSAPVRHRTVLCAESSHDTVMKHRTLDRDMAVLIDDRNGDARTCAVKHTLVRWHSEQAADGSKPQRSSPDGRRRPPAPHRLKRRLPDIDPNNNTLGFCLG